MNATIVFSWSLTSLVTTEWDKTIYKCSLVGGKTRGTERRRRPATGRDEKLVVTLQRAVTQLHRLLGRVHRHHLRHRAPVLTPPWKRGSVSPSGALHTNGAHLLPCPHLNPMLLIEVTWTEENAAAVQIQSLREATVQALSTNTAFSKETSIAG